MATKNYTLLTLLDRNNGIADSNKFDISIVDYDDVNINDFEDNNFLNMNELIEINEMFKNDIKIE